MREDRQTPAQARGASGARLREKWVVQRRPSRPWPFLPGGNPRLCSAPPRPAPSGFGKQSLRLKLQGRGRWRPSLQVRSPGGRSPVRPRAAFTASAPLRPTYPRGPFGPPALLPTGFAGRASAGRLQRPRGRRDPSARTTKAPRVRPGLERAERARPRSANLSAHQLASVPAPGPVGPRPPGRAVEPLTGPYDGALLGEKG